jgi:hypothetical protein
MLEKGRFESARELERGIHWQNLTTKETKERMLVDDLAQIEMKKDRDSVKKSWRENITRNIGKLEKKTE